MMRNWLAALAAVAVLAGFSGSASAQLYKWVDEAGEIHYSDEKPGGDVESSVVPEKENFSVYSRKKTSNPIIRPHDRIPRKLLVLDPLYLWKSESYMLSDTRIGNYHVGKACTSRGPIMAPKVFVHHKKIFPLDSLMSLQAAKLINRLEFDSERVSRGDLNRRLQQTNGLTLHSTITEMFLKTCAPNTGISARLQPVENVPPGYFSKNKVRLIVKWQLKSVDGEAPIYES